MKIIKGLSYICISLGIILLILPNMKAYRDAWDALPYFQKLDKGFEFLTTFGPEKTEKDGKQREKALNSSGEGFNEVLHVLRTNSEKLKGVQVDQITNRKEFSVKDNSGNVLNVLNIIFVHSTSSFPPYIAIASDNELQAWIQNFKKRFMLLLSGLFLFLGAVGLLFVGWSLKKLGIKWIILIVFSVFFIIPIGSFFYGALSWKDLLSYVWIIPITIVALFQDEMKKRLFAPRIELEFKLSGPYCLETKIRARDWRGAVLDERPAYYFRFRVKNIGQIQAKLCECVIEELWFDERGEFMQDATFQPVNLNWSNGKAQREFMDINPHCPGWFCDLVHVEKDEKEFRPDPYDKPQKISTTDLVFDFMPPFPNSQYHILRPQIRHRVKIAVYSENASPVKRYFEINWSGAWKENTEEMFKEFQIAMS